MTGAIAIIDRTSLAPKNIHRENPDCIHSHGKIEFHIQQRKTHHAAVDISSPWTHPPAHKNLDYGHRGSRRQSSWTGDSEHLFLPCWGYRISAGDYSLRFARSRRDQQPLPHHLW